jgi:hypothetical protein
MYTCPPPDATTFIQFVEFGIGQTHAWVKALA